MEPYLIQNPFADLLISESSDTNAHAGESAFGGNLARLHFEFDAYAVPLGRAALQNRARAAGFILDYWHAKLGERRSGRGQNIRQVGGIVTNYVALVIGVTHSAAGSYAASGDQAAPVGQGQPRESQISRRESPSNPHFASFLPLPGGGSVASGQVAAIAVPPGEPFKVDHKL
jgi:hypothetical protein